MTARAQHDRQGMWIKLKRGLDLKLAGAPRQEILTAPAIGNIGLLGQDCQHLRPALAVAEGDEVSKGQLLFEDRRHRELRFTAPAAGRVISIDRGPRRALGLLTIALGSEARQTFPDHASDSLAHLPSHEVREQLLASGLWTALRTRPYNRVPLPTANPVSIFVTAIDTNPLCVDPALVIRSFQQDFENGLKVLSRLTDSHVFVCVAPNTTITVPAVDQLTQVVFDGPHPAGLPGTHIHQLASVRADTQAWHIGYQDVIAVGKLFVDGQLWGDRVIAVGGPGASRPQIVTAPIGADLKQLLGEDYHSDNIVISGSVLSGRRIGPADHFLGRYDLQVTVLPIATLRDSHAQGGWPSGMVPVEAFERVWPFRAPVGAVLRAVLAQDTHITELLGCLALDAEDLALCSYVCPSKCDYGSALNSTLAAFEKGV